MDILTSGDLTLSVPTPADIGPITAACQDPAIAEFTTVPFPYTTADARQFVRAFAPGSWARGGGTWAIRHGGHLAGVIGLSRMDERCLEVGYWLDPAWRGRAIVTNALTLVLDYGFTELGAQRIHWRAAVGNWASWKAAWRQGFRREGTQRATFPDSRDPSAPCRDEWTAALLAGDPRTPATAWDGPQARLPAIGNPRDPEELVRQFHVTYGLPIVSDEANVDIARVGMRMALISEEFTELFGAVYGAQARLIVEEAITKALDHDDLTRDTVEAADALADLIYVIYGMALETGIPLDAVLREVQRSNLSKLGADGKPVLRADGKILKGPDFFPPDIGAVLHSTRLAPRGCGSVR